MKFKILTLFPDFFSTPLKSGLLGKVVLEEKVIVNLVNIRDFAINEYGKCDDYPYGGGSGMVIMAEPIKKALDFVREKNTVVISTSPSGRVLNQEFVKELADYKDIVIICGHYEGIDNRIIDNYVDYEVSVGDYVLSGGEFAALNIIDAVSRYVPGFMSNESSLEEESFESDLLEYPQYTRPANFEGLKVPDLLIGGNHKKIKEWRLEQSIKKTKKVRPDLFKRYITRKLLGE